MPEEIGPIDVAETVAPVVTLDGAEPKPEPVLLSTEELASRAKAARSPDGRLKHAEPVWVRCWDCHVMVAPMSGISIYERMFGNQLFGRDLSVDDANVDVALMKEMVVNCVVKPQITDEMVDDLAETNATDFMLLASACMVITQKDPDTSFSDILGIVDTETRERFTAGQDGSTSTQTPA